MNIKFTNDYQVFKAYVMYISSVTAVLKSFPIKFYKGDGDDVVVIDKRGDKVDVISNYVDVSKIFNETFDSARLELFPDDIYLVDYVRNMILSSKKGQPVVTAFNYMPPREKDITNFILIGAEGSWYKCYGKNSSILSAILSLDYINYITPTGDKLKPTNFGVGIICDYLSYINKSEPVSAYDVNQLPAGVKPSYAMPTYNTKALYELYLSNTDEDDPPSSSEVIAGVMNQFLARENRRARKGNKEYTPIPLGILSKMPVIPNVKNNLGVKLDYLIAGIDEITILPKQILRVKYDPYIVEPEDILDIFDNIQGLTLDDLELIPNRNILKEV